ncbi:MULTISPECIES: hypothetical protein [Phaeobacter]|uniref:hypothetical protein n=1 Tax=Phaeobacter TaxID=302485 RepID=UPI00058D4BA2|nr:MULTISPECIES: hypothetical protein [Phaeobacter]KII14118.1 hypothetical protein OO25_13925 [Phaeobacter sp. S60]UTS80936.1 hypothetical protein OL67_002007 [Phaeobacter piscinae]
MRLDVTTAGFAARQAALQYGTPLSPLHRFEVSSGGTEDLTNADRLSNVWAEVPIISKESKSAYTLELTANIPPESAGQMVHVGLLLEDGTLYATATYSPETEGIFVDASTTFTFFALLTEGNTDGLQVTYSALDIDETATRIADQATAQINARTDAGMIEILKHLSGLNREILTQQDKLNTLETSHV